MKIVRIKRDEFFNSTVRRVETKEEFANSKDKCVGNFRDIVTSVRREGRTNIT